MTSKISPNPPSTSPSPKFQLFPLLPPELRFKIWDLILRTTPRHLYITCEKGIQKPRNVRYVKRFTCKNTPPPAMLGVCREARELALEMYSRAFGVKAGEGGDAGRAAAGCGMSRLGGGGDGREINNSEVDSDSGVDSGSSSPPAGSPSGKGNNDDNNSNQSARKEGSPPAPSSPSFESFGEATIYVSFPRDVIHIPSNILGYLPVAERRQIQHLVLDVTDFAYFSHFNMDILRGMTNLRILEIWTTTEGGGMVMPWGEATGIKRLVGDFREEAGGEEQGKEEGEKKIWRGRTIKFVELVSEKAVARAGVLRLLGCGGVGYEVGGKVTEVVL